MENLMDHKAPVLGVDIGGTHITAGLVDIEQKMLIPGSKCRANVYSNSTGENIIKSWIDALESAILRSGTRVNHIGIAMPGPFDYANGICLMQGMHKYDSLYGMDIKKIFAEGLHMEYENIQFRNDAEAFLAGEVFCGAATGYAKAVGITLGTGMGSAVSEDGITRDVNLGSAPFLDGITEDYISKRWFLKKYQEITGVRMRDVKLLAESAEKDSVAAQLFKEFSQNLSAFLQTFIDAGHPRVVVIGGGISGAHKLFLPNLIDTLSGTGIEIKISKLGEEASLIGAAAIFNTQAVKPHLSHN